MFKIAVDASNISSGGGLTHLTRLLGAAEPKDCGVDEIHIWTSSRTAKDLPRRDWLIIHTPCWCNSGLGVRALSQHLLIPRIAKKTGCCVLFSPGGSLPFSASIPTVTMSQNMLPFELDRAVLFGRHSWMYLKMRILRVIQGSSLRRADGIIFLTNYAQKRIEGELGSMTSKSVVIPHGVERRFLGQPSVGKSALDSRPKVPMRLLYVSVKAPYKHHLEVMKAISELRRQGLTIELYMAGENVGIYGKKVQNLLIQLDPERIYLHDLGHVNFNSLHELYKNSDIFVFASSCENLPNILIEAMAAGLPIACSFRGPMPEVLGDGGIYFDPESPTSIAEALSRIAVDGSFREALGSTAWRRAQMYSWERCANDTLKFITKVALKNQTHEQYIEK